MIRKIFFGDLWTKATAFVLAVLSWAYLYMSSTEKMVLDVPLELEYDRDKYVVVNEIPDRISGIELTAKKGLLSSVVLKRIKCVHKVADLFRIPEGQIVELNEVIDHRSMEGIPKDVSVTPRELRIRIDAWAQKKVRINPAGCYKGAPAPGYKVREEAIQIVPGEVAVRVPASELKAMPEEVSIDPVDVADLKGAVHQGVMIRRPEGISQLRVQDEIRITLPIESVPDSRTVEVEIFKNVPAAFPHDVEITPSKVRVRLEGPRAVMETMRDPARVIVAFFTWDPPAQEVKPGDKFRRPVSVQFIDGSFEGKVRATVMPEVTDPKGREIQIRIKERPGSSR